MLGIGAADNAVANFDASSWLWSSSRGEVDRVNGITARVDTRTKVKDAQNHDIQITQTDKYLILRDLDTGQVSALDLTTLQVSAVLPTTPGLGVSVALHGETAFVIDSVQGQVRQLDPRSLAPTGELDHPAQRHRARWLRRQGHALGRRAHRGHRGRHRCPVPRRRQPQGRAHRHGRPNPAMTWCCPRSTPASRCSTTPSSC